MNRMQAYAILNGAAKLSHAKRERDYGRISFDLTRGNITIHFSLPDEDITLPKDAADAIEGLLILVSCADTDPEEYADSEGISLAAARRYVKRGQIVENKLFALLGADTFEYVLEVFQESLDC